MSVTLLAREPGAPYEIGAEPGRKVHLFRLYQTRSHEGAMFGRTDREHNRRIIENALAFARQRLKFRGIPQLVPVSMVRATPADGNDRLPDILCIGEFMWPRPVRDPAQVCSSATLVWFQDAFAPPISQDVLDEMREIQWDLIAVDWSW